MLMRVARNERRPRSTREGATFWLGQLAEEPATRGLAELVGDDTLDRKVRESAIFALSQRRDREGVPALINVVRTSPDPELRKKALFWLAQSKDPRALDLIEELLRRG
jgi:HEAT repeat protein